MIRGLRSGSLIGVLLLGLACGTEPPTGPATTTDPHSAAAAASAEPSAG